MTVWRPNPQIRVKALGLLWRDGRLLVAEVRNDAGQLTGYRPLGGTVDFGETWQQALVREFAEELSVTIAVTGAPIVVENIYTHEGETGHEIVFAGRVDLISGTIPDTPRFEVFEDNACLFHVTWIDPVALQQAPSPALFPEGLLQRLDP